MAVDEGGGGKKGPKTPKWCGKILEKKREKGGEKRVGEWACAPPLGLGKGGSFSQRGPRGGRRAGGLGAPTVVNRSGNGGGKRVLKGKKRDSEKMYRF